MCIRDSIYTIELQQIEGVAQHDIDTEDSSLEKITINSEVYYMIDKDGKITIFWSKDNYSFVVISKVDRETAIKIVKEVIARKEM